jgi:type VI secretion system VasD/TssJ family lipoprotein
MYKRIGPSLLGCLLMVGLLVSCAAQPVPPPQWTYEKDALQIHLIADPKLNFESGVPHTLVTCVYQLKDPNAFNQLSEDINGIYKLLDCGLFDAGVATAKRLIVHPGQDVNVLLDRAEGAKYVAVVCGYYILEKARMIRLYEIPVAVEEKGLVKRTKTALPQKLKVDVNLGMEQIN